jgi:hypothetical protein
VAEEFVERVRYVADISDVQEKLGRLADDSDKLAGDAESSGSRLGGVVGKITGGLKTVATVGAAGVAAVGVAAIKYGPMILEQGAQLEALGQKSKTVFEGSLASVQSWADGNAKALGLTKAELVGTAAGIGDLLKPMGFTAEQAAGMSTDLMDLSGALSAWTGGQQSATDVADTITKAMLGERDGLKSLGISISEADVQARLAANGQADLTGAALEQAKALATQQLILEKSTDAQKAWADGSMDAIKQQNETKASMAQLKETLITGLYPAFQAILPAVQTVAEWLGAHLPGAMAAVRDWVAQNWPAIKEGIMTAVGAIRDGIAGFVEFVKEAWATWGDEIIAVVNVVWPFIRDTIANALEIIRGIIKTVTSLITGDWSAAWDGLKQWFTALWEQIKTYLTYILGVIELLFKAWFAVFTAFWSAVWNGIKSTLSTIWEGIKTVISTAIDAVVGFITGIPGRIASVVSTMWNGLKDGATAAKDWVVEKFDAVVEFVGQLPGKITEKVKSAFEGLKTAFKDAINWVIDRWNSLDFGLDIKIPDWVPIIGGKGFSIPDMVPDLPRLHSGGVFVAPTVGGDGLALLRDGERVTPAPAAQPEMDWDQIGDRIGRQVARTLAREMRAA